MLPIIIVKLEIHMEWKRGAPKNFLKVLQVGTEHLGAVTHKTLQTQDFNTPELCSCVFCKIFSFVIVVSFVICRFLTLSRAVFFPQDFSPRNLFLYYLA